MGEVNRTDGGLLVHINTSLPQHNRLDKIDLMSASAVSINSQFDSGNGELVDVQGDEVLVRVRPDPPTQLEQKTHMQVLELPLPFPSFSPCRFSLLPCLCLSLAITRCGVSYSGSTSAQTTW